MGARHKWEVDDVHEVDRLEPEPQEREDRVVPPLQIEISPRAGPRGQSALWWSEFHSAFRTCSHTSLPVLVVWPESSSVVVAKNSAPRPMARGTLLMHPHEEEIGGTWESPGHLCPIFQPQRIEASGGIGLSVGTPFIATEGCRCRSYHHTPRGIALSSLHFLSPAFLDPS